MSAAETPCDNWGGSGTAARSSDTIVTSSSWLGGVGCSWVKVCSSFWELSGVGSMRLTFGIVGEGGREAVDNVERGDD